MEPEFTDEELREITRRKREDIRQGQWKPGKVEDLVRRAWRKEREKRRRAPGRVKGKNKRELPKSKYTIIEDEVLEAVYKQSFGVNQGKVFWYVIRNTWGWEKQSGLIRVTQCAKQLGIPKQRVSEALSSLVKRRIVTVNRDRTYAIQIDTSLWRDKLGKKKKK